MMRKKLLYFLFSVIFLSCNSSLRQIDVSSTSSKVDTLIEKQGLVKRANDYYENNMYLEAKLSYDTLISIDSSIGEYFFKRGYCKTMLSTDNTEAIKDYLKAIEYNYNKKEKAYLNIGSLHRGNAIFHSETDSVRIVEYNKALYFYNEALKIDSNYVRALNEKKEVTENLKELN